MIDGWGNCEIALRQMLLDLFDVKSTLVQVMVWCRQATSHYMGQYWPRFMLPYGITRPQWVNPLHTGWFWGTIKMYLHFLSFYRTETVFVVILNENNAQIAKFTGPTWVLSAPDEPHVGPMSLVIRVTHLFTMKIFGLLLWILAKFIWY